MSSFFTNDVFRLLFPSTLQTLQMVFFSTVFSLLLGVPLGVLLTITSAEEQGGIMPRPVLNSVLGRIVNILRSFPFIILMILLFPLSRILVGTSIGTTATIVPLSIAAAPFVARVIETALKEVDPGVVQAARAMGSTTWQIIWKVLIPEATPSLISGVTLTIINLIGYSAMAGAIGGGGLGDLAIRYGFQRFRGDVMFAAVVVILVLVELIQVIGNRWSARVIARR
ncbi:methionine ABC transporter permease [Parasphaerochaeta coccoides]|uniref:Binding-protein-dependent transport systems inner membrane component n=1 Tax=Parasphaerochaeta coccoides (strain ATCC BAA-1237 / DSM 17374 / SPN1) TaxID=760011 RepID=F4GKQ1_PARC1|nr:methionine ABC transporter permease [Parasphaerochaeta coccoides]AEC01460.1 binding-protein-dependent transport systems inner membrane component [Parasphaerochaeta coccoides DSM 17374]